MNGQAKFLTRLVLLATVLNAVFFVGVLTVSAEPLGSHNFPDVATSAFYHNAVEWIFNRNITAGCGGGLYCPNNSVTRGEMAVFMQKLGNALTPVFLEGTGGSTPLDPDTAPIVCQTADYAVGAYPSQVLFNGSLSIKPTGPMAYYVIVRYSTNGGANWSIDSSSAGNFGSATDNWDQTIVVNSMNLNPGTTYRFGIQVGRPASGGTGDISDHTCELVAMVLNRNGTTSPLSSEQEGTADAQP